MWLFFRALLVSRRVTSWEGRSLIQAALLSSALSWRFVINRLLSLNLLLNSPRARCVGFPTWMWWESAGRGWRGTPGVTRRFARRCSGWQRLGGLGRPRGFRTSSGNSGASSWATLVTEPVAALETYGFTFINFAMGFTSYTRLVCRFQYLKYLRCRIVILQRLLLLHFVLVNVTLIVWYIVDSRTMVSSQCNSSAVKSYETNYACYSSKKKPNTLGFVLTGNTKQWCISKEILLIQTHSERQMMQSAQFWPFVWYLLNQLRLNPSHVQFLRN